MPIYIGAAAPPPPPPIRPGRARRTGKRVLWTSPTGDTLDLTGGEGYTSLPGREGFAGLPDRNLVYTELPAGGAELGDIVDQVRVLANPLSVRGATAEEYLARFRRLQAAMRHPLRDGARVPGLLTVRMPDGSQRSIAAYYHGGLKVQEEPLDDLLVLYQQFPNLEFLALDPYWEGGTAQDSWGSNTGSPWLGGSFPLLLSPSAVLGTVTTVLPGDADSWPVWTITGPGAPIVTNLTSGRSWQWRSDSPIPSGRTVTVDTRPTILSVVDDLGTDLYEDLDDYPDLWPLEPGENQLQVEITDATSASSAKYEAAIRWQGAW